MTDEVLSGIRETISDVLFVDVDVERGTVASDVPGWDSLAHIKMLLALEKRFGVRFDAEEMGELRNLGDLADVIAEKRAG